MWITQIWKLWASERNKSNKQSKTTDVIERAQRERGEHVRERKEKPVNNSYWLVAEHCARTKQKQQG